MNLKTSCLVIILVATLSAAKGQDVWTLEQCVKYAIDKNITIKQQEISVETSHNSVKDAIWSQTPTISGNSSSNVNFGRTMDNASISYTERTAWEGSLSVGGQMNLFKGFNTRYTISKSRLDLNAALQTLEKTKNDIALNVAAAYLQILFSEELVSNAERQVELTKSQVERTRKLVDAGNLSMTNLFEIQSQESQEEVTLVNAQNQLAIAYLTLKQLLEISVETPFKIYHPADMAVNSDYQMSTPSAIFDLSQNLPEIKSAEIKVESAEKSIKIAQSAFYPSLSLSVQYGTSYFWPKQEELIGRDPVTNDPIYGKLSFDEQLRKNGRTNVGLSLNIPIFSSMRTRISVNNARLGYTSAQLGLQLAKNTLYKQISQAYSDATGALKKFSATQRATTSYIETFKSVEAKFNVGAANSLEYNTAKNNLSKSESELVQAKFDYIFKTKILDFYKGVTIKL